MTDNRLELMRLAMFAIGSPDPKSREYIERRVTESVVIHYESNYLTVFYQGEQVLDCRLADNKRGGENPYFFTWEGRFGAYALGELRMRFVLDEMVRG